MSEETVPTTEVIGSDQERVIIALVNEPTVRKAAQASGISEATIYRWMKEPEFSKMYREARRENFKHAIALTQKYAPMAVQALAKILADPAAAHSAKVSAATALLKFSRDSIELDDLAERVELLEQQARDTENAPRPFPTPSPTPQPAALPAAA